MLKLTSSAALITKALGISWYGDWTKNPNNPLGPPFSTEGDFFWKDRDLNVVNPDGTFGFLDREPLREPGQPGWYDGSDPKVVQGQMQYLGD